MAAAMAGDADQEARDQEAALQAKLESTEQKIQELQQQKEGGVNSVILSSEQRAEIEAHDALVRQRRWHSAVHDLLRDTATSVERESGVLVRPVDAADAVLDAIDTALEELRGGADLIPEWRASLATLGQHVTVHRRQGAITGLAEDVDSNGHLLLRTRDGILHVLAEGDVTLAG